MSFVVAEPCIKCKYTDCVDTCPVDCFHEGPNMLVIDPDACIHCGRCEPACSAGAIFLIEALPEKWAEYIELNARLAKVWPVIKKPKDPLPDADRWRDVPNKRDLLDE